MKTTGLRRVLVFSIVAFLVFGAPPAATARRPLSGTIDDLLSLAVRPFAIGHRGSGANLGEDPAQPIENTVPAVRSSFRAGVSVIEVDVQVTSDGEVAAFHNDFLPDFTCLNRLTLSELQARLPFVPSLEAVLNQARQFNQASGPLRGLVIVELKPAAPLCDPDDTQERAIAAAVTRVIRRMEMTNQALLTSFSPALLFLAAGEAPEIARGLTISGLQFLTAPEIETLLCQLQHVCFPVTPIDKHLALGLQWAEVGPVFRLPGYRSVEELLQTVALTGARVVEADLFFLGPAGTPFIGALHALGLKVFGFTATNAAEWFFLESLGLDGIYTDDVPLGVENQAAIP